MTQPWPFFFFFLATFLAAFFFFLAMKMAPCHEHPTRFSHPPSRMLWDGKRTTLHQAINHA
jgi:hypothetical protein